MRLTLTFPPAPTSSQGSKFGWLYINTLLDKDIFLSEIVDKRPRLASSNLGGANWNRNQRDESKPEAFSTFRASHTRVNRKPTRNVDGLNSFRAQAIWQLVHAGATVLVLGIAVAAGWMPARRGMRIQQMDALRGE